jgi:murein L,D-transpeptidase YafK
MRNFEDALKRNVADWPRIARQRWRRMNVQRSARYLRTQAAAMLRRAVMPLCVLATTTSAIADYATIEDDVWRADRVLVVKSERLLHLMRDDQILRSYSVSLGGRPAGHKSREGDLRTPEGDYYLDWRNPTSDFYMSIHVSYPNADDIQRARAAGRDPGGMIMIHGLPNDSPPTTTDYLNEDWTDGCIAVSNQAMIDIWLSVDDNTPITILP